MDEPTVPESGVTGGAATRPADILFVTRKWPPAMGGMETYSVELTRALAEDRNVDVVALPGRDDGAPPTGVALLAWGARTAFRLLRSGPGAGQVHIGDMASWPLGLAAKRHAPHCRVALSAHGTDVSYSLRGGLRGTLYGLYLRLGARALPSAVVIANSAATAECTRIHGYRNTVVVPLATALRPAAPPGPPEPFVLFAGRLVERKGCAWFIRNVLPLLPEPLTLKVAGTVWSADEGEALDHPRVEFLGPQPPGEIARLYALATCVVTPNVDVANGEFEGFGLVATEASASGGVSLASAHSGLNEAVVDGVTGFLLPPGDAEAWAAKIDEISAWTPEARRIFLERAMAETHRRYSWERVARDTLTAYG